MQCPPITEQLRSEAITAKETASLIAISPEELLTLLETLDDARDEISELERELFDTQAENDELVSQMEQGEDY